MIIKQQHIWLASAPALVLYNRSTPGDSGKSGTVLFYHDHNASKESHKADLTRLAQAGFLAIGIDNVGHGERRSPGLESRFQTPGQSQESSFLASVHATAVEVPMVIDALIHRGWSQPDRIGIMGISMGGFITYAAIVAEKKQRLRAAAPIVGSPIWLLPRIESPHQYLDRFFPTALLSQTAAYDTKVPPALARAFHQWLAPYYGQDLERLHYIEYAHASHDLSADVLEQVWRQAIAWFERFLTHQYQ